MTFHAAPVIYDALVVGGGPAGLSAALTWSAFAVLVFDSGDYRNHGANEIHIFLYRDGVSPELFCSIAR